VEEVELLLAEKAERVEADKRFELNKDKAGLVADRGCGRDGNPVAVLLERFGKVRLEAKGLDCNAADKPGKADEKRFGRAAAAPGVPFKLG